MANTFLILAVCIYLNKNGSTGPHLDKKKVQQLPDHFGPARASVVLQQAVQACIDCAYHQKTVFSFLKQGHGGEVISGETWPAVLCHQRWHHKNSLVGQCLLLSLVQSKARGRQAISLLSSLPNICVREVASAERGLQARLLEEQPAALQQPVLPQRCPSPQKEAELPTALLSPRFPG